MTDNRVTQVSLEEFASTNPPAQVTQVTIEQWTTTATVTGQVLVTQVALEQWIPAAVDLAGNLGAPFQYGKFLYGKEQYSRISAFAPIFAADLGIIQGFSAIDLAGGFAPTIVLGASSFVSEPLWASSEVCPSPPWAASELCPPSLWTPTVPPNWAVPGITDPAGYGKRAYGKGAYTEFVMPWAPTELCDG